MSPSERLLIPGESSGVGQDDDAKAFIGHTQLLEAMSCGRGFVVLGLSRNHLFCPQVMLGRLGAFDGCFDSWEFQAIFDQINSAGLSEKGEPMAFPKGALDTEGRVMSELDPDEFLGGGWIAVVAFSPQLLGCERDHFVIGEIRDG